MVMEGTNARYVNRLPEDVTLVTVDASFISLKILLPVIKYWFPKPGGDVIALVKPQFEAGRKAVSRGSGVIRSPAMHRDVLKNVLSFAHEQNYSLVELIRSPLLGPKGNVEFLAWLNYPKRLETNLEDQIKAVLPDEHS